MKREDYKVGDVVKVTLYGGPVINDFIVSVDGVIHLYNKGRFGLPKNWEHDVAFLRHDASLECHKYGYDAKSGRILRKKT